MYAGAQARRYRRVVSGANTAVSSAATPSTIAMSPASAFPSIRPREAVARIEIGLIFHERLETGRQSVRLDEDVAQEREREVLMKPAFMTAFGERGRSPWS